MSNTTVKKNNSDGTNATSDTTNSSNAKRPVAKHACLACRDKKIKCDGEVLSIEQQNEMQRRGEILEIQVTLTESGEIRHRQCTNCKNSSIQCIFVKSQRGGRKKKDLGGGSTNSFSSTSVNSIASLNSLDIHNSSTGISQLPQHHNINNTLPHQQQPDILHHQQQQPSYHPHPSFNLMIESAPISNPYLLPQSSLSNLHYPSISQMQHQHQHQLQPQPQPQPIQQQPLQHFLPPSSTFGSTTATTISNSNSTTATSFVSSQMNRSGSITSSTNAQDKILLIQRDNRNSLPGPAPSPQQFSNSSNSSSPTTFNPPSKLIFSNPASKPFQFGTLSKPSTTESHIHNTTPPPLTEKIESIPSIKRFVEAPSDYITIPDDVLAKFDLPPWQTTAKLIDLYYRYIHPSRPFLPPKHRLVYELNVRNDASLLHAMFTSSCRFANIQELKSAQFRDSEHWYFLAEKYWDYLNLEKSLQALVLLMGSLGPNGYVQQSIEGCERIYKLFQLNSLFKFLDVDDFEDFKMISTKRQIINYEDLIRTVWGSWKLNVFLRINRGVPFKKISESILEFPDIIPFPLSDLEFNENSKIYNDPVHNSVYLQQLKYKRFKEINEEFLSDQKPTPDLINDESCIILAVRLMEMIMNDISTTGPLSLDSITLYNTRLDKLLTYSTHQIYQFSNIKKPTYYINISKVFAVCIGTVAKLSINVLQCAPILLIKPHRTDLNKHPDYVFNSLNESKIHEIEEACLDLTPHVFNYFIKTFISSFEIIKIIELGYGITHSTTSSASINASSYVINPNVHVVGGPTNFQPANKISSMRSDTEWWVDSIDEKGKRESAKATDNFGEFPDVWLQYPVFSVVCVGHSLTVLASSIMLTKQFQIIEESVEITGALVHFEMLLRDGSRLPLELTTDEFKTFKENFNMEKLSGIIKICSKYIQSHGKYWAYVESISDQADGIVNYIDDLIHQRL